ncbi:MAG: hypothetical protein EBZ48_10455, partial [Proteobacteria bacterium]|nr:hypothetical protein [Pseudomonadota bacterium]
MRSMILELVSKIPSRAFLELPHVLKGLRAALSKRRSKASNILAVLLVFLPLVGCSAGGNWSAVEGVVPARVAANGTISPLYTLKFVDVRGQPQTLERFKGRPFLLTFWAPWCVQCLQEMESIARLGAKFDRHTLPVVGVAVQSSAADVEQFERSSGLSLIH